MIYNGYQLSPNLIPEFEGCIEEAQVIWFVMENVRDALIPVVRGYHAHAQLPKRLEETVHRLLCSRCHASHFRLY